MATPTKKNKKALSFFLNLEVYPFDVLISMGQTDAEVERILRNQGIGEDDIELALFGKHSSTQGRACMFQGNQSLIRLRNIPRTATDYGYLQHEIFHCVSFIMYRVGIPLKMEVGDEAYAYLVGFITTRIYLEIDRVV